MDSDCSTVSDSTQKVLFSSNFWVGCTKKHKLKGSYVNTNIKVSSLKSSENIKKKECGSNSTVSDNTLINQSRTNGPINTHLTIANNKKQEALL